MPRACPICGSRKWRKDGVTGSAVCEDGHVLQGFRSENLVVEPSGFALQKRTLKRAPRRNRRKEAGNLNLDYYHGHDAELLKLQGIQLLLRLQVEALTKLWSLPDIFETIVRDIWAYQLSIHSLPPPPEPSLSQHSTPPPQIQSHNIEKSDFDPPKTDEDGKDESDDKSGSESHTEKGSDEENEFDLEIDSDILEELSDESTDREEARIDQKRDSRWRRRRRVRVSDTLVTLVLGLWIVRYPILLVDLENLVNDNKIPYLDFAHSTLLPNEMAKHMNRDVVLALSPSRSPKPTTIFETTRKVARILNRGFGVIIPEINLPPLAWRIISSLGGTPTTYTQVIRLMALLDINTSLLNTTYARYTRRARGSRPEACETMEYDRATSYQDVVMPEMAVASAWLLVMKMLYGLDGVERCALVMSDPAIGLPTSEPLLAELGKSIQKKELVGSKKHLDRLDFAAMFTDDLDRFLDRSENVLLKDRSFDESSTSIFPLPSSSPTHVLPLPTWTAYHQTPKPIIQAQEVPPEMPNKSLPLMPGEKIRSYDSGDVTGTLPKGFEVCLNAAAEVCGVHIGVLGEVLEGLERRLEKYKGRGIRVE